MSLVNNSLSTNNSGFYVYDYFETKYLAKVFELYGKSLKKLGFLPMNFPKVGLLENFYKEKSHFNLNAQVLRIEKYPLFLAPTTEAIAYPILYSNNNLVLPFKWFQLGPVYRNESKYCRKFIRHKEIAFFHEAHGIYGTEKNLKEDLEKILKTINSFLKKIGLDKFVKLNLRPPEDTFPGANRTYAFDITLPKKITEDSKRTIQLLTVHDLGKNFSTAYRNQKSQPLYGLCFGVSERLFGCLLEYYNKDLKFLFKPDFLKILVHPTSKVKNMCILKNYNTNKINLILDKYNPCIYTIIGPKEEKNKTLRAYRINSENFKGVFSTLKEAKKFVEKLRLKLIKGEYAKNN